MGYIPYFSSPNRGLWIIANQGGGPVTRTITIHKPTSISDYKSMSYVKIRCYNLTTSAYVTASPFNSSGIYNTGAWSSTTKSVSVTIPGNTRYRIKLYGWAYITTSNKQIEYGSDTTATGPTSSTNTGAGLEWLQIHNCNTIIAPSITVPAGANKTTYAARPYVKMTVPANTTNGQPIESFYGYVAQDNSGEEIMPRENGDSSFGPLYNPPSGTTFLSHSAVTFVSAKQMGSQTSATTHSKAILNSGASIFDGEWENDGGPDTVSIGVLMESPAYIKVYGQIDTAMNTSYIGGELAYEKDDAIISSYFPTDPTSNINYRLFKFASRPASITTAGTVITAAKWNSLNTAVTNHNQWCLNADGTSYAVTAGNVISKNTHNNLNSKIVTANNVFSVSTTYTTVGNDPILMSHYNTASTNLAKC